MTLSRIRRFWAIALMVGALTASSCETDPCDADEGTHDNPSGCPTTTENPSGN